MQCSRRESCSRGFTPSFTLKVPRLFVQWYDRRRCFPCPLAHSEVLAPVQSRIPSLSVLRSPRALTFGYGCAVHVGVSAGAGDAEVDVIYITFIMSAQYTGYLVLYKVRYNRATGQLTLCVWILSSERGVLNPFLCEVTNIYRCQLNRICDVVPALKTHNVFFQMRL